MLSKLVHKTTQTLGIPYFVLTASLVSTYVVAGTVSTGIKDGGATRPYSNLLNYQKKIDTFRLPASLAEIEKRYRELLPQGVLSDTLENEEERRLLVRALHREIDLRSRSRKLDSKELDSIHAILEMVTKDHLYVTEASSANILDSGLTAKRIPSELVPYLDIYANMERMPYFKSQAHHQWVKSKFPEMRTLYESAIKTGAIKRSLIVLPVSRVFEDRNQINAAWDRYLKLIQAPESPQAPYAGEIQLNQSFATLPYFAKEKLTVNFLENAGRSNQMGELFALMDQQVVQPLFPFLTVLSQSQSSYIRENPEFLSQRRKMYEHVWKNRGLWATLELIPDSVNVDWPKIWGSLGIDPAQGKAELVLAAKEYAKSPAYAQMLKAYSVKPPGNLQWRNPNWTDPSLIPYLRGDLNPNILADKSLRAAARKVTGTFIASDNGMHDREFMLRFKSAIVKEPRIIEGLGHRALERLEHLGKDIEHKLGIPEKLHYLVTARLIKAIDQSGWSFIDRSKLLKALVFMKDTSAIWSHLTATDQSEILAVLKRYGLYDSAVETINRARYAVTANGRRGMASENSSPKLLSFTPSRSGTTLLSYNPTGSSSTHLSATSTGACPQIVTQVKDALSALGPVQSK